MWQRQSASSAVTVFLQGSKVPLKAGGESKRIHCKAELVRVTLQIGSFRYRPNAASGGWSYGRDLAHRVKRDMTSSH